MPGEIRPWERSGRRPAGWEALISHVFPSSSADQTLSIPRSKLSSVLNSISAALFRRCHQHTGIQIQATAIMELARVDALVTNIAALFESGLDFYTKWKKKLERQPRKDAVSTSLDMSSHRIKATYQVGFAMIGPDFSAGDGLSLSEFRSPLPG